MAIDSNSTRTDEYPCQPEVPVTGRSKEMRAHKKSKKKKKIVTYTTFD